MLSKRINSLPLFCVSFWTCCLSLASALGAEKSVEQNGKPEVNAWIESAKVFENGKHLPPVLKFRVGATVFGFALIEGLRVNLSNPENVTISDPSFNYFLSARIVSTHDSPEVRIQTIFPNAVLSQQGSVRSLNRECPVFMGMWKPENGPMRQVMVAFINTAAGTLEVTLTSRQESFSEGQNLFTDFLTRAKSSEQGPVKFLPQTVPTHS